jgi:hypothetical protein
MTSDHDKPWRKLYRFQSGRWLKLSAIARGLASDLLRYAEGDGAICDTQPGETPQQAVAYLVRARPHEEQAILAAASELLVEGYLETDPATPDATPNATACNGGATGHATPHATGGATPPATVYVRNFNVYQDGEKKLERKGSNSTERSRKRRERLKAEKLAAEGHATDATEDATEGNGAQRREEKRREEKITPNPLTGAEAGVAAEPEPERPAAEPVQAAATATWSSRRFEEQFVEVCKRPAGTTTPGDLQRGARLVAESARLQQPPIPPEKFGPVLLGAYRDALKDAHRRQKHHGNPSVSDFIDGTRGGVSGLNLALGWLEGKRSGAAAAPPAVAPLPVGAPPPPEARAALDELTGRRRPGAA